MESKVKPEGTFNSFYSLFRSHRLNVKVMKKYKAKKKKKTYKETSHNWFLLESNG